MQRLLDRRLAALVQDAAKSGWQLDIAPGRHGGWPFAATRTLPGMRLHGGEALAAGGIVWSGERITASLSLLHPQGIGILTDGTQVISAGNAGLARSLRFWGTRIGLRLPFRSGTLATRLSFDAQALRMAPRLVTRVEEDRHFSRFVAARHTGRMTARPVFRNVLP